MHTFIQGIDAHAPRTRKKSEEPPPEQEEHKEPNTGKRSVLRQSQKLGPGILGQSPYLLHQQLPIDAHGCPSIFLAVFSQST